MGPTAKFWKKTPGARCAPTCAGQCTISLSLTRALRERAGYMLYRAVASGDSEEVSRILSETPEAAKYENEKGENCLHAASEYGVENYTEHHKVIQQLAAAGCDLNKSSAEGRTPLMTACYYGHASCVEQLLKLGADKGLKVRRLPRACAALHEPVAQVGCAGAWLLRERVTPSSQDGNEETALNYSTLKMGATIGHTKCRQLVSAA
jgi:ankyrin repeat protein